MPTASSGAVDPAAAASSDLDGSLLVRARTDPDAFHALYRRNHDTLLRHFMRLTGSAHTSAELAAETFAQALACVDRYDPAKGNGTAWLFGIANHQFHSFLRRGDVARRYRSRLGITTPTTTEDDIEHIEALADIEELLPQLNAALAQLSTGVRAAVELRVGHDLPYAEVAARLGCTVGSARVRVARGLRSLNVAMREAG
ncbi:MAG: RNA polymerase sigma factor [Acidimicrobiales bacterium]|nr:RNA polymerase sigma factor [Acidimicrobiales bacterium]